ncbi:MAG: bifunctional riboflavin kinase/FAD synthetase [Chloroflexi bacterium]|nr:bifunctional riboflavin kinase/FAD synthetase [Chloroflexota bacterium]
MAARFWFNPMQHTHNLQTLSLNGAWLSVGVYDGVHLGHRAVLEPMIAAAHAAAAPAAVLTFDPHPAVVFSGPRDDFLLTTPAERADLMDALGVDVLITFPFSQAAAATPARQFVESLHAHLGLSQLWVGEGFAMGHNRQGDIATLADYGKELGFAVRAIPPLEMDGAAVSSTRIRAHLAGGDVEAANALLGRAYSLRGVVVRGDGRGRTIGIPTANLSIPTERAVPANGVYAGWAKVGEAQWPAVTNIGVRPTFASDAPMRTVETHLLDYEGDLYGRELELSFTARLRGEQKFSGVEALVAQIHADIARAREVVGER